MDRRLEEEACSNSLNNRRLSRRNFEIGDCARPPPPPPQPPPTTAAKRLSQRHEFSLATADYCGTSERRDRCVKVRRPYASVTERDEEREGGRERERKAEAREKEKEGEGREEGRGDSFRSP